MGDGGGVALVTGAARGTGAETARLMVEAGARVVIGDVLEEEGRATADELGDAATFVRLDVTDEASWAAAVEETANTYAAPSILVNNAGISIDQLLLRVSAKDLEMTWATNVNGAIFCSKACIRSMMRNKWGRIISLSSVVAESGNAGQVVYSASKAALLGMTRSLAREFGPDRIRVNALAPGWVLTEKQLELWATDEGLAAHMERMCLKEHLKPEDIVGPALFLASSVSGAMTGQALVVDGGVVVTG